MTHPTRERSHRVSRQEAQESSKLGGQHHRREAYADLELDAKVEHPPLFPWACVQELL